MPVKWVVAGVGDIARKRVIPAILEHPESELYGVVTRDARKAEAYPGVHAWTALDDALHDDAVNAVYIATPVALHAPYAIAALRAGKHVLCEKPMAMNYGEAQAMTAVAAEARTLLGVAYYRRLYPKLLRLRELLRDGAIGKPVLAEAHCHNWLDTGDRGWLLDPALAGGGPLYDVACHRIDVFNFLFGAPAKVAALLSNAVHEVAVEDSATVSIDYADGVRGIVDVRWNSRIVRDEFRVICTEGEIDLTSLNGPQLRVRTLGGERIEELPPHANLHYPLVANFVCAISGSAALTCTAGDAVQTDWVIEQAARPR
ncbi:MAG: Gfo/Idh/MocA family oxidoreductase [Bryobacteraceae bacterium]